MVKVATNFGNLVGQLLFGYLGDKIGRKGVYGTELILVIACTFTSAVCGPWAIGLNIVYVLAFWRFFLGIGIGGDYPMSATITAEFSSKFNRGMMLASVFAMQGFGILVGSIVFICSLLALKGPIEENFLYLDYVWRIAIGFGLIPSVGGIYFRLTMPESPRYKIQVQQAKEKLAAEGRDASDETLLEAGMTPGSHGAHHVVGSFADFKAHFGKWENGKVLLGCAYCWFALDVAWYGMALNQSTVLKMLNLNGPAKNSLGSVPPHNVWDTFYNIALGNLIIACAGTVPGYWFTVGFVEILGRKFIQYMGFAIITVILAILAAFFEDLKHNTTLFMILFTIAQFFFQFGPNSTTFIFPGEVFPTRFRGTGHGLSSAAGKFGAIVGVLMIAPFFNDHPSTVLALFAAIMATGFFATALLPETKGKSLEELSGEDIEETEIVIDTIKV
jgi:MFS transporter, PHS family, inorganic phosphate transporter